MMLPIESFKQVVQNTPLVSIDLVVKNAIGQVLLGMRQNAPAKGYWFVPGGRILKDESVSVAFERLVAAELGVDMHFSAAKFHGVYEHLYNDAFVGETISTHYVVLAYQIEIDVALSDLPEAQHSDYRWFDENALADDPKVHKHSKWYFETNSSTNFAK